MQQSSSARRLALASGGDHLAFHCNRCGECCKRLRVAPTHHDLRRLARALGSPASELVEWLPPAAVDMAGEPGSFLELPEGRRLMVLRQRHGACHLLDAEQRCGAYAARPLDCAVFPFDLEHDAAGAPVRLSLLPLPGCSQERGEVADLATLSALDAQRWRELAEFQALVAKWNRLVAHRGRFGRSGGNSAEVLAFFGL